MKIIKRIYALIDNLACDGFICMACKNSFPEKLIKEIRQLRDVAAMLRQEIKRLEGENANLKNGLADLHDILYKRGEEEARQMARNLYWHYRKSEVQK